MLDRAGITLLAQKRLTQFITKCPEEAYLFSIKTTSGTTSEPLVSVMDNPPSYFTMLGKFKMLIACYGSLNIRLANALYADKQKTETPLRVLLLDAADIVPGFEALFADLAPDAMRGFPSFIIRAAERVPVEHTARVNCLQLAGELFTNARVSFFAEHFPEVTFERTYITAELGRVSEVDCGYLPFNQYHPQKGVTITIDTPDNTGVGTLLVTKQLDDMGTYVEKYRIGDTGRWQTEPCPCGEALTFEVLGREGFDYIKILGGIVRVEEAETFAQYKNLFDDYRVELEEIHAGASIKGSVTLHTYSKKGVVESSVADKFLEDFTNSFFITPTKTLKILIQEGLFEAPTLVQETDPFRQGPKEFKLRLKK